ncbi:hypothetical protein B0H12DRAFT_148662 [Mycena haematopus]|nr:hypothetical protein B0H12DRAFT_148662 [Mycena haematopus]
MFRLLCCRITTGCQRQPSSTRTKSTVLFPTRFTRRRDSFPKCGFRYGSVPHPKPGQNTSILCGYAPSEVSRTCTSYPYSDCHASVPRPRAYNSLKYAYTNSIYWDAKSRSLCVPSIHIHQCILTQTQTGAANPQAGGPVAQITDYHSFPRFIMDVAISSFYEHFCQLGVRRRAQQGRKVQYHRRQRAVRGRVSVFDVDNNSFSRRNSGCSGQGRYRSS